MPYYAPFYRPTYYNPSIPQDMSQYGQSYQQPAPQYQPPQQPQNTAPQNNGNGLIWVQGEAGAKSYLVAPGNTVMLMDSENSTFYLKSADSSGMPMPLRIFDYTERKNTPASDFKAAAVDSASMTDKFITREEFEQRIAAMGHQCHCKEKESEVDVNGESTL